MRINSIGVYHTQDVTKRNIVRKSNEQNTVQTSPLSNQQQVTFKGWGGKIWGGTLGAGLAGLCAIAAMATPAGWVATAALLASEAGGAVVGGAIGDKIEGKDDDE